MKFYNFFSKISPLDLIFGEIYLMDMYYRKAFLFLCIVFLSGCSSFSALNFDQNNNPDIQEVTLRYLEMPSLSSTPILVEDITSSLSLKEKRLSEYFLPSELLDFVPKAYRIQPGDKLFIYVYGENERISAFLASRLPVNPMFEKIVRSDGTIFYPNAGILNVKNKSVEQVRQMLTKELSEVLADPQVDVSVTDYNSQFFSLSGAFEMPGRFPIKEVPITLHQVISNGNPFLENKGDLTDVKLIRDKQVYSIDYEYLSRTSHVQNEIYIKSGDIIHLPDNSLSLVHVLGEARRPVAIPLSRAAVPLSNALSLASGLDLETSNAREVFIFRPRDASGSPRIFTIDMSKSSSYLLAADFEVRKQDIIYISTRRTSSWSKFVEQLIPFVDLINRVEETNIVERSL